MARLIAFRYLVSKKSHSVINLISVTTIVAIAVPTAAMIILLSVHNGFQDFIGTLWSSFNTPLVIEPTNGKYFNSDSINISAIISIDGVKNNSSYIEDNAIIRYKERQCVAVIRGVESNYNDITDVEKIVVQGVFDIDKGAIIGRGIAYELGLKVNLSEGFTVIAPSANSYDPFNPSALYSTLDFPLSAIFTLDAERDSKITFVSISAARELFGREPSEVTSIAIDVDSGADIKRVKSEISKILGSGFCVKDLNEQNILEYNLIRSEKVAIYLIILLVMVVASFTLIGTVIMLIIEKRESLKSLRIIGTSGEDIRKIFISLSIYISVIGAFAGAILGISIALAQQIWGFVPIAGNSLLIDKYPVKVILSDSIVVIVSVIAVTFTISWITNKLMIREK